MTIAAPRPGATGVLRTRHKGNAVVLFQDQWALRRALQHETAVTFHETQP